MCAKLRTVAASSNRDHAPQSLYYCLFIYIYIVVVRAHPVRGESHTQRNASGEVATAALICFVGGILIIAKQNLLNSASQAAIA